MKNSKLPFRTSKKKPPPLMTLLCRREVELIRTYCTRLTSDVVIGRMDRCGIEVLEIADEELLALDEDTVDTDEMVDDEATMELEE